jgi:tetratricopeptide (TPR) repeat protein
LADEVVEARPPSAGYRLRKFARHHRTALSTAVAFAGLLVLAAAICAWQAIRATRAEAQALTDRDEAVAQRQRAKRNYELARQAVENYLSKVTDNERLKETDLHAMRKELLESALPYYEKFAQQEGDDAEGEAERGRTYYRLAQVRFLLGEREKALSGYKQMESIFAPLAASYQEEPEYKRYLALSQYGMASILTDPRQQSEADNLNRAALVLQEQLVDKYPRVPEYRKELADTHKALGSISNLGNTRLTLDWEKELRCALSHYEKLVTDFPRVKEYDIGRASIQHALGNALILNDRYSEAEDIARHLLADLQGLPAQTRGIARLRLTEARVHGLLAWVYARQRLNDEAVKEDQADIDIKGALAAEFPSVLAYRQSFAYAHRNLGHQYHQMRLWEQSKQEFLLARTLLERLADDHPDDVDLALDVVWRDTELAKLFIQQGRSAEVLDRCKRAEQRIGEIRRKKPGHASLPLDDESTGVYRACALAQQGRYEEALAEAERWGAKPSDLEDPYYVACAYSLLSAAALQNDKLAPPKRAGISEAHASQALKLLAGLDWKKYGWYFEPSLKTDNNLNPLRARPDFIALVKRAEKESAKQAGK